MHIAKTALSKKGVGVDSKTPNNWTKLHCCSCKAEVGVAVEVSEPEKERVEDVMPLEEEEWASEESTANINTPPMAIPTTNPVEIPDDPPSDGGDGVEELPPPPPLLGAGGDGESLVPGGEGVDRDGGAGVEGDVPEGGDGELEGGEGVDGGVPDGAGVDGVAGGGGAELDGAGVEGGGGEVVAGGGACAGVEGGGAAAAGGGVVLLLVGGAGGDVGAGADPGVGEDDIFRLPYKGERFSDSLIRTRGKRLTNEKKKNAGVIISKAMQMSLSL
nr:hypothetical protein Iba_scaffold4978CG0110 [Ipomoea batatas]